MKFLRVRKQKNSVLPGFKPGVFGIILYILGFLFCFLPGTLTAEENPVHSFYYAFNTSELDGGSATALKTFVRERANAYPYALVQGFGCDRGGFQNSQVVARNRGRHSVERLMDLKLFRDVRESRTIILYGPQRDVYRRMDIRLFRDSETMKAEQRRLNAVAARLNLPANRARQYQMIDELSERDIIRNGFTSLPSNNEISFQILWIIPALLLLLFLILIFYVLRKRKAENEHLITPDEAEALEILTATADVLAAEAQDLNEQAKETDAIPETEEAPPEPEITKKTVVTKKTARSAPKQDSRMIKSVAPVKILDRSKQIMARKKQTKITPITIKGALDREFEEKTLKELAKSPIHALEGLSPRHARLMEEGFGIKTIEDLAKLKYFEIAKAITTLAKYEK